MRRPLTIGGELSRTAACHPRREAVVDPRRRLTYGQLDARTDAIAGGLLELGVRSGDRVVLQVANRVETVEAWYGLLKAGAVPVCTLAVHGHHEVTTVARAVGARGHLFDADNPRLLKVARAARDAVDSLAFSLGVGGAGAHWVTDLGGLTGGSEALRRHGPGHDADALAVIQLSGGTTGLPKAIPRHHAEYWLNAVLTAGRYGMDEHARIAHVLPLVHNAGIHSVLHAAHSVGAAVLLAGASPAEFIPFLAAESVTEFALVPGLAATLLETPGFLPLVAGLRRLTLSGATVPPNLFDTLESAGVTITQQFGMGEGLCTATPVDAPREMRRETVGFPLSSRDQFFVAAEDGTALPDDEVGELCVRGPYTITSYYGETAEASGAFTPDGFLRTGDLAVVRVVGGRRCLAIAGRVKDLINRGGEKVNAEELELLLGDAPGVAEVAVVAMPDLRLGERTCAYVVPRAGAKVGLEDLTRALEARGVARYKWPERLELIDQLPRTPTGKVAKARLRGGIATRLAAEQRS